MDDTQIILPTILYDDKLSTSEIVEEIKKMKQQKTIEKKYESKIKLRKDGRQYYIILNRKQLTAKSKELLYEKLWQMEYGRQNSSIANLYPEWMTWKRDYTAVSSKTLKEYSFLWKKYFENEEMFYFPMKDLKTIDFINFFRKITQSRQLTKKLFGNIKSLLNGIMAYAVEQEIIIHNPILDINCKQFPFKPVNKSNDTFTITERKQLLDYLKQKDDIYSLAIQLDFHLVLRIGELLALRWSDIEGDFIHIQNQCIKKTLMKDDLTFESRTYETVNRIKGNSNEGYRFQPITPDCKKILEHIKKLNPDGEYILMCNGSQLLTDTFNEHLRRHCCSIGIKPRSSHKIRFTVASILFSQGVELTALQQLLGHTTLSMTMHYIKQVTPLDNTIQIMSHALG